MNETTSIVKYGEGQDVLDVDYVEVKPKAPQRPPLTLLLGLVLMIVFTGLLMMDVRDRGGAILGRDVLTTAELPAAGQGLGLVARWVSSNYTPLIWLSFLILLEGLLTRQAWKRDVVRGGCVRTRPWLFFVAFVTSVTVWCGFDLINFYLLDSWVYIGLSEFLVERYVGYFIAFGAIGPAMFMMAHYFQRAGMQAWETRVRIPLSPGVAMVVVVIGSILAMMPLVFWQPMIDARSTPGMSEPERLMIFVMNAAIWVAPLLILDPINVVLGRPSLLQDWGAGRWGRTVALSLAGLVCGFLWELWNYWATTKWVYQLEFLGPLQDIRYFEMPLPGLLGFIPFALSYWVILQTILAALPNVTEKLPDKLAVL